MDKLKAFYEKNKTAIIIPTVVMLSICIIITAALAITNKITDPVIAKNTAAATKSSMESLIKADKYKKSTLKTKDGNIEYHTAIKNDKEIGYIFNIKENGYGGEINIMVAVNLDCTVKSVSVLDVTSETPGLGQNVANKDFYKQFEGKGSGLKVQKDGGEIEAVSSATISSRAMTSAIDRALGFAEIITKDKGGAEK